MANTNTGSTNGISLISFNDGSKKPYSASSYMDMRGVVDFGNLIQFAPYESGYCFLAVLNGPAFAADTESTAPGFKDLQAAFIKILEQEFKGLDGIEDITSETMDISDNISTVSLISKVTQNTNNQISMRFTEKSGTLLTKYISTYLKFIRDPKTQAKTYGGAIKPQGSGTQAGLHKEVFNMLYIVTDSTCLNVEKSFLILNAQPTSAAYSELYNSDKGEIGVKEITVTFNAFVVDGVSINKAAQKYIEYVVSNTAGSNASGQINVNSWEYNWTISGSTIKHVSDLTKSDGIGGTVANKDSYTNMPSKSVVR